MKSNYLTLTGKELEEIIDNILSIKLIFFKELVNLKELRKLITPGTYYIMIALEKHGKLSMTKIGRETAMPKPNVTSFVDILISKHFAERIPGEKDRRIINIKLTKKGLKAKKEIDKFFRTRMYNKLKELSSSEIKNLSSSLISVREVLSKLQKDK
jgi:DNA-binding MarR family transcriptional regulator